MTLTNDKSRRARLWWLPVLALLAIGAAVWGRNYYESRYVGTDYWAQIPAHTDIAPQQIFDLNGDAVYLSSGDPQLGTRYDVTAVNEAGEQRALDFTVLGNDPSAMPQPGSVMWLSASEQMVVSQRVVPESEVPANVLEIIQN